MWTSPPPLPDSATLQDIPGGAAGTRVTLAKMVELVRKAKTDVYIRLLAGSIIAGLPHKAYAEQAAAVQRWVQDNVQYVRDIHGVETLTPPAYLLRTRQGDCDDQAMLVAALLASIGLKTAIVAGGPSDQRFEHVWTEVNLGVGKWSLLNGSWQACETTEPWPLGARPPFRCYLTFEVPP